MSEKDNVKAAPVSVVMTEADAANIFKAYKVCLHEGIGPSFSSDFRDQIFAAFPSLIPEWKSTADMLCGEHVPKQ